MGGLGGDATEGGKDRISNSKHAQLWRRRGVILQCPELFPIDVDCLWSARGRMHEVRQEFSFVRWGHAVRLEVISVGDSFLRLRVFCRHRLAAACCGCATPQR